MAGSRPRASWRWRPLAHHRARGVVVRAAAAELVGEDASHALVADLLAMSRGADAASVAMRPAPTPIARPRDLEQVLQRVAEDLANKALVLVHFWVSDAARQGVVAHVLMTGMVVPVGKPSHDEIGSAI